MAAILLVGMGLFPQEGKAQTEGADELSYTARQWTIEEGLPVNTVRDITQGPQGYLWLATYAGLVRFDGVEFSAMTAANSGLPTNRLLNVGRGPEGGLWVRTDGGQVVEVDPARRAVLGAYGTGAGGVASTINQWAISPDSTLWLGASSMLYRRLPGAETWEAVVPHSIDVVALESAPEGGVWVGTVEQGVWRATRDSAWQVAARTPAGERPTLLTTLAISPTGVWAGGEEGVFRVGEGVLHFLPAASPPRIGSPLVLSALPDRSLWLHTRDGTLSRIRRPRTREPIVRRIGALPAGTGRPVRLGPEGRRWTLREHRIEVGGRTILRAERPVSALRRDREGNWWVGTAGDGLYRLRRSPITMIGTGDGLPAENVYGVVRGRSDPSSVWVGSIGGGLARIRAEPAGSTTVTPLQEAWGLPPIVWTMHEDRSGTFWIGTEEGLYRRRDGAARQAGLPSVLQTRRVRAVYEDRSRRLWVLAAGVLWARSGEDWHRFSRDRVFPGEESEASGRVIAQTQNGSVWIGTDGAGLVRVRGDSIGSLQIGRVRVEDGLPSGRIRSIHEDQAGRLWIGTGDRGLAHIDRQGTLRLADDSITAVTRADGLPGNTISQILPDGQGRLWMSTNRGIFRVEKKELVAFVRGERERVDPALYTETDGLASREANGGIHSAGTRTSRQQSERLWFPTQEGVAVIDPAETGISVPPSPAALETISARDKTYEVGARDTLRLAPAERTFTAEYAGLHFADPSATRFEVRLAGFDRRPTRTARRSVRYTEVESGTYELVVRASAGEGEAWGEPARLVMTVAPFWWETQWFYGLCGLGLLGLVFGGYRWRTRRLRKRQEQLERAVDERTEEIRRQRNQLEAQAERLQELDEAKSRFFANISHEFRTPLTLIRGPVQEVRRSLDGGPLAEEAEQLEIAERNTARLQRLVDQLLGLARLEAGTYELNARPTHLSDETARIVRQFDPLAEREGLSLAVEAGPVADDLVSDGAEEPPPVYVDREALERILGNLLSNAIKFTPEGGHVEVTVSGRPDAVEVAVADTGPGIPEAEQDAIFDRFEQSRQASDATREREGTGIGLAFAKDLLELHGGTIDLESIEGEGSTFTVTFPRGNVHLSDDQLAPDGSSDEPLSPSDSQLPTPNAKRSTPNAQPSTHSPSPLDSASEEAPFSDRNDAPDEHSQPETRTSKLVLVVDDNADVRRYVRSVLEPQYAVIEAADGEEGLDGAREQLPDVILADVMMPDVDGHEMTRRLKENGETEAIPVIMVTARAETRDEVKGLEIGADDYVTKPFDADVLRQRVGGIITMQQRLRRRLEATQDEEPEPEGEERAEIERRAREVIRQHLTEPEFEVTDLADEMAMSRSTLYRNLKDAADLTPSVLITKVRIEAAKELLRDGESVSQVAYAVGFDTLSTFSSVFRDHVGTAPSAVASE